MQVDHATIPPALWLPVEVTYRVFSFLDYFNLTKAESVCKKWRFIANDPTLWKPIYLSMSDGWLPNDEPVSWKVLIKRTFYVERCMLAHKKKKDNRHLAYLKAPENAPFVFYDLCGGPQHFYQIPLRDGEHGPSLRCFMPKEAKRYVISREVDASSFRFEASQGNDHYKVFGMCIVEYSKEICGVICQFFRFTMKGYPCTTYVLTKHGVITKASLYRRVKRIIQSKLRDPIKSTASAAPSSYPVELTLDRLRASPLDGSFHLIQ